VPCALLLASLLALVPDGPLPLQEQLASEDPSALARAAREQGDPARGAIVFYQKHLACTACHGDVGVDRPPLGPDLAAMGPGVTDAYLVASILDPSREIKKGFEPVTIATVDGKTITGLIVEDRPDRLTLRDPAEPGKLVTIAAADVEGRKVGGPSLMPAGLANALGSRQEFLDLIRYLREVADGGPARARALRPDPSLLAPKPLPEYERDIDHAGMISPLNAASLKRGEAIYEQICANCHGTIDRPGSMPTSLRFASGAFKLGGDPYAMYRTLTHGFGLMPPQSGLVPRQKYDVIHYIREAIVKDRNPAQYRRVDAAYLAGLPKGKSHGPSPTVSEPWKEMDYGPTLMASVEVGRDNLAYKGISVRLDPGPGGVSGGRAWAVYDHDTMQLEAAWSGRGFIDWNAIGFNGRHEVHAKLVGTVHLANPPGPGWADPKTGRFDDPRPRGRDGRPYGPMPREWIRYRGLYHHGDRAILSYTVGDVEVLDSPGIQAATIGATHPVFTRTLEVGPRSRELQLQVAPKGVNPLLITVGGGAALMNGGTRHVLRLPPSDESTLTVVLMTDGDPLPLQPPGSGPEPLSPLTKGGPARWPQTLKAPLIRGRDDGPFAVDVLAHPMKPPWSSRMRFSGLDFLPGGRSLVVCDWDGDVWRVDGLDDPANVLTWRRIASGLFQPLGVKVIDGAITLTCRDQIAILRDLNGDGEADFIEAFNTDQQVTDHFHEFAMDLQVDPAGNLYYTKGARHGATATVPQHGTLLRVSKDGLRTDILATGFRAPNGVCLNPDGTFFITDQEGHWIPKNRINHVKVGGFYGNMWGYHEVTDPSDLAMEPPVCWITNAVDRSPSEIVRVEGRGWGPLEGQLLSLSYGYGKVFVVPHETVAGRMQGGVAMLPIPPFPTGIMRGRFHPGDGALYACGLFGWASNQEQPGGLYRVRPTGKPLHIPIGLHARRDGMAITFTGPIDPASAADASRFAVKTWSLRRTANYGSPHVGETTLEVASSRLEGDGRTVLLTIPRIAPTMSMEIGYALKSRDGAAVVGAIHNTIHALGE
jgi:putative heme-binding domain-containing protein